METSVLSGPPRRGEIIIGREREQRLLAELLDAALARHGRLVLVGGEAGIGKTTLVRWLADAAAECGALVLSGGSYDLTATPPYGPWLDAFAGYIPADGMPPPPQFAPAVATNTQAWFDTIQAFVTDVAAIRPLVIVLEDLHWADPASLDLLRHLARRCEALPILLVGTYRDDEVRREQTIFQILPLLVREARAERIDLRRLDQVPIQAIVIARYELTEADRQRLVTYLVRHSDGNPLFLVELLRTLEGERLLRQEGERWTLTEPRDAIVPSLLHQVIERRLAHLTSATRDALAIAAIIGDQVPATLWSRVGNLADRHLAQVVVEAVEAHVLEEVPASSGYRFSHALVRAAIRERLPLPLRRDWHGRVAGALVSEANPHPDEVAFHFQQAGDTRAIEWHIRAGLRARRVASISAAEHFGTAANLLGVEPSCWRERGWLYYQAGDLLSFAGDLRAIGYLDAAERTGREVDDPILAARACCSRGRLLGARGELRRGLADIERGVAIIDALAGRDPSLLSPENELTIIRTLLPAPSSERDIDPIVASAAPATQTINLERSYLAHRLSHAGRYREAIAVAEPLLADIFDAGGEDSPFAVHAHAANFALAHSYAAVGRPEDARREYERGRAGAALMGSVAMIEHSIWLEQLMVLIPYQTDHPAERTRLVAEAAHAWEQCRGLSVTTAGDAAPSELQSDLLEGRWAQARQLAISHLPAPWFNQAHEAIATLAILDRHRGKLDHAWNRISDLLPQGPETQPGDVFFAQAIIGIALAAELALDAGDLPEARRWIETHARWLDWNGAHLWLADTQLLWARYHEQNLDLKPARQHARAALELASDPRQPLRIVAAKRLLGRLDMKTGDHRAAEALLIESLRLAEACAAPFEQALSLLALAELHLSTGQRPEAQMCLKRVNAICIPLDAQPLLEQAAAIEARISTGPPNPDGLTAREIEVLRLIAAGQSNREIADTLFISPRTIERHIANIYLKIDAHNKVEATAYAQRHNLV